MEVIAIYNYTAQEDDELSLNVNDIIKDVSVGEGGWWTGVLNGKRGFFPDNFVQERHNVETTSDMNGLSQQLDINAAGKSKARKVVVWYPYTAKNEDELSLTVGDTVDVLSEEEEGWWKGLLAGKTGLFPSNFVKVLKSDNARNSNLMNGNRGKSVTSNILTSSQLSSTKSKRLSDNVSVSSGDSHFDKSKESVLREKKVRLDRARVVYSYVAENDDELTLNVGDTIVILEKNLEDSGWWKGEINGKIGVFPDNFVELVPANSSADSQLETTSANVVKVGKKLERPPPPDPDKVAALKKTVPAKPSSGVKRLTIGNQQLIALTDDHKVDAIKTEIASPASNNAGSPVDDKRSYPQSRRPVRPLPPNKFSSVEDKDQQPPLPPKSPVLRDSRFSAKLETESSAASQRRQQSDKYVEPPVPRWVPSQLSSGVDGGRSPSPFSIDSLHRELVKLQETVNHFKLQSERKMRLLQAEIEEEKYARQALQAELEQIKKIVGTDQY